MSLNTQTVQEQIKLGIKTYKTGDVLTARLHFQKALREDPENIPSLLWLAFIISDYDKQVFLLERILEIDPVNERAKKGLSWVKQKMIQSQETEQNIEVENISNQVEHQQKTVVKNKIENNKQPQEQSDDLSHAQEQFQEQFDETGPSLADLKSKLVDENLKKQAKKGTIAQRARRRINPLVMIFIGGFIVISLVLASVVLYDGSVSLAALAPSATHTVTSTATASSTPSPLPTLTPTPTETVAPPTPTPTMVVSTVTSLSVSFNPLVHQPAYPGEKWIEVNVSTQRVTAWEGDKAVMSFIVSTGLPNTPTVLGKFRVYQKLTATRMSGVGYDLPNVPHTMYFHQGYALHGAYWHENFGEPMSHGCVNLSLPDAETLFNWAEPAIPEGEWYTYADSNNLGTLVVVHQ